MSNMKKKGNMQIKQCLTADKQNRGREREQKGVEKTNYYPLKQMKITVLRFIERR